MRVGIVGYGIVGQAMQGIFSEAIIYDKYKDIGTREEVSSTDICFVCVPTPLVEANGKRGIDLTEVDEVMTWLRASIIVVKSTMPVTATRSLANLYPKKKIVFNPEFLRNDHSLDDVRGSNREILGGFIKDTSLVEALYRTVYPQDQVEYVHTDYETAEMVKYTGNAFLSLKVTFCNEIDAICQQLNLKYEDVRRMWLLDKRVGASHTEVRGGFGGKCLPKDLAGLIGVATKAGYNAKLLKQVEKSNEEFTHSSVH